jgi:hypothetical protein
MKNSAHTKKLKAGEPAAPASPQAAYSPAQFAALFGKSAVWAYRLLYAGKVKAITGFGRILIPHDELLKLLSTAATYEGQPA